MFEIILTVVSVFSLIQLIINIFLVIDARDCRERIAETEIRLLHLERRGY